MLFFPFFLTGIFKPGKSVFSLVVFSRASQPAAGERRGSVGHPLCVALRLSDDETPTEPLNLCIADELAALRLPSTLFYNLGVGRAEPSNAELLLSKRAGCVRPHPACTHMGSHVHADPADVLLQLHVFNALTSLCLWRNPSRTPKTSVQREK